MKNYSAFKSYSGLLVLPACLLLAGCQALSFGPRPNSPDVAYSSNPAESRKIQVPPDLTSLASGEQFVVPGDRGSVISRNTLLPVAEAARLERQGGLAWLVVDTAPENLWPILMSFVREEGFEVSSTLPPVGQIATQWRGRSGTSGSFASESSATRVRIGLRLERSGGGSRVFARLQTGNGGQNDDQLDWDRPAANPERSSIVLQRLLVFLGLEEQRARSLIDQQAGKDIFKPSQVASSGAGSTLVIHQALKPGVRVVTSALKKLGVPINRRGSTRTSLAVSNTNGVLGTADTSAKYVLLFNSAHQSRVDVSVADTQGARIEEDTERTILTTLLQALIG